MVILKPRYLEISMYLTYDKHILNESESFLYHRVEELYYRFGQRSRTTPLSKTLVFNGGSLYSILRILTKNRYPNDKYLKSNENIEPFSYSCSFERICNPDIRRFFTVKQLYENMTRIPKIKKLCLTH